MLGLQAASLGFIPRKNMPGYVLKGTAHSWEGWVHQEKENGPCTWWLFVQGFYHALWQEHKSQRNNTETNA